MFTRLALEGRFTNLGGTPASGTVTVTPNSVLLSGDEAQGITAVSGILDAQGRIVADDGTPFVINATDDASTSPIGSSYAFLLKLDGRVIPEFSSYVPRDPGTWQGSVHAICYDALAVAAEGSPIIHLIDLIASEAMVGSLLVGTQFSGTQTIASVDEAANTVTVGTNAISSGVDANFSIQGGCVNIFALRANAL